jgi:tetratricopeptide (TPR) repeat protein
LPDDTFDVFLSHNSKDKPAVRQIAEALRDGRGLNVWLDEWELPPGVPWQDELEKIIRTVRSSAVLVGKDGLGPWEIPEMRGCLSEMVRRGLRVIPVLLPGAPAAPDLPLFLAQNTWVDLRDGNTEEGLDRLQWGITGIKPVRKAKAPRPTAPRLHNLPFSSLGHLLKGRDEELQKLQDGQTTAITQTQTIYGLGGIGKTRLAVEYAWASGERYDTALFVVADPPKDLRSGLANLARPALLNLPEYAAGAEDTLAAVLCWLRDHDRWLLILDNVDSKEAEQAVMEILPSLSAGRVLITSRIRDWPAVIQKRTLGTLSVEEGKEFLLVRTENDRSRMEDDAEQARRLAEELGGLPLALEQAAAYIAHHQMSLFGYLEDWQREREQVLNWYDLSVMQYPASVAVTWQKTFQQLSPTAAAILRLTAYLAPDPIPSKMFEEGVAIVKEATGLLHQEIGEQPSATSVKDGIAELSNYSMVNREAENFTVHRMVQDALRSSIPEESRKDWIEHTLRLVNYFSPTEPGDVRTWPIWDPLQPHATQVVQHADEAGIAHPTADLKAQLAILLFHKGLYRDAEPLMRRVLQIDEDSFGPNHPNVARDLNNLAQFFHTMNQPTDAEPLIRRALQIDEDSFGPNHPRVAIQLNSLARSLKDTNRLEEAEPLVRRALQIDEDHFGPNHPQVAGDLSNLAQLLWNTNRLEEAEPMLRRALEIDEDSFGPNHPEVATDLHLLAQLLQAMNQLADAEPLMRRSLQIDEDSFGPNHPRVAIDLNNLARLLHDTNRLEEAEPLTRRSQEIFEQSLGVDHPSTQSARRNLATLLQEIASRTEPEPSK